MIYGFRIANGLNILPNLEEKIVKKIEKIKEYPLVFSHIDASQICLGGKQKSYIVLL